MTVLSLDISHIFDLDISGEVLMSLIVMVIISIFAIVTGAIFRHHDPTKPDRGFIMIVETAVSGIQGFALDVMGKKWIPFSGYILGLAMYIFLCFFLGITGLPNALINLTCPLSIGLCTFLMIHATAIKANHWKYFHRYIDPFFLFLPINLLSMWSPLLSITLRLFGNAFGGYVLMSIVYFYLNSLSSLLFGGIMVGGVSQIWIAPFVTSWLHIYFDLFSGAIQTLVFCMLTMIWVSQEDPEEEEMAEKTTVLGESV